jgi:hypothetical protein
MTKSALGHKRTYAVQNAMSALCPIAAAKADISSQIGLPAWAKPYAQIRGITVGHEERILFAVALATAMFARLRRTSTKECPINGR